MQTPPVQTRVVPANALFTFQLPQREYGAALAALQYFARKLQDPRERALAESALTWMQNISGMTLPSEAGVGEEPASAGAAHQEVANSTPPTGDPPKGLNGLKGAPK